MPTVVVDASVIGAILFDEPRRGVVIEQLEGFSLTAPMLIRHELVSVAMKKCRLRPGERRGFALTLRNYPSMLIHEQSIVTAAVFELALEPD